jgi:hypothetical protein
MAIIATVGGTTSNSYGTLAEAEAYFLNRLDTEDWDDAEQAEQEQALIQATLQLDELDYIGQPATDTQALKWPRVDDDVFALVWGETEIPPKLKLAEFELALSLLDSEGAGTTAPVSSLKIGSSVQVSYDTSLALAAAVDSAGTTMDVVRLLRGLRLPTILA